MKKAIIFLTMIFLLTSCKKETTKEPHISTNNFKIKINKNNAQLVDVRTLVEYDQGYIQNAILIDYTDKNFIENATKTLDKSNPVYVYCLSGGKRSQNSVKLLREKGYDVYDLVGGIVGWKDKGYKTVKNYSKIGMEYALATKMILGKNLKQSIAKDGVIGAMSFCNEQAYSLTDSMQVKYNAIIKRVSDKNRNKDNKANTTELQHIAAFKEKLKNGEKIKPIIEKNNGKVHFYAPIKTNQLCLQCHGKQLQPDLVAKLKDLYPADLAIGYDDNQVRGIWSITFDE